MYSDRLTGVLTTDDYLRLREKTKIEMSAVEYRIASLEKKATFPGKNDLFDFWRPLPDLNRCRRRERAVS